MNPFKPQPSLLAKIGSAIIHADEAMSENGVAADEAAFRSLLSDHEVTDWLRELAKQDLLPVKR